MIGFVALVVQQLFAFSKRWRSKYPERPAICTDGEEAAIFAVLYGPNGLRLYHLRYDLEILELIFDTAYCLPIDSTFLPVTELSMSSPSSKALADDT